MQFPRQQRLQKIQMYSPVQLQSVLLCALCTMHQPHNESVIGSSLHNQTAQLCLRLVLSERIDMSLMRSLIPLLSLRHASCSL